MMPMTFEGVPPNMIASVKTLIVYYRGNMESDVQFQPLPDGQFIIAYSPVTNKPETTREKALEFYDAHIAPLQGYDVYLYGNSLGAHFASYVASRRPCKSLILETPLVSLEDCIENYLGRLTAFIPGTPAKGRMLLAPLLSSVNGDIHVFVAADDEIIPSTEEIKDLVTTITVAKCKHNETRDSDLWKPWIRTILTD